MLYEGKEKWTRLIDELGTMLKEASLVGLAVKETPIADTISNMNIKHR